MNPKPLVLRWPQLGEDHRSRFQGVNDVQRTG